MTTNPTPQNQVEREELDALLFELEDATHCSYGDNFTQNEAAKKRAIEAKKAIKDCISKKETQVIDEDYLLECFESVACYAKEPYQLGGMKPETALVNYKNRLAKRVEAVELSSKQQEKSHE